MKSTTLAALALSLLMLLLVLLAAFFFVFRGQLALQEDLASKNQTVDTLNTDKARLELEQSELQATSTRLYAVQGTLAAESTELRNELVASDLQATALAAEWETAVQARDAAKATRDLYESTGPLVTIIEPRALTTATVGEALTIVIIASDVVEVEAVNISVDNEQFDTLPVTPGKIVKVSQMWTPDSAGQSIITVTAVNSNNVTSQPAAITIAVQEPIPSSTPTSTVTPTPSPTAEITLTPST